MRSINYKEKDFDQIFKEMTQDAFRYGLTSNDEHYLDYINNREDIEKLKAMMSDWYRYQYQYGYSIILNQERDSVTVTCVEH